jgi:hypothetical protein
MMPPEMFADLQATIEQVVDKHLEGSGSDVVFDSDYLETVVTKPF